MNLHYAAGLFDGEGYVRIARWKKPNTLHVRYQVFCGVGMTHRPIIEQLHEAFGGTLHMNRSDIRNPKHKIQYSCIWASQTAATFLRQIHPFTVVKKEQIECAFELQEHINNTRYTPKGKNRSGLREGHEEILNYREELFQRIIDLRKIVYEPFTD